MLREIRNISEAVKLHAANKPDKPFIILANQKTYSYKYINNSINNVCTLFETIDLTKGDIISAVIQNSVEYVIFYLASLRFGTVFNPYPYTLDTKDIIRYLSGVDNKVVFCQTKHFSELRHYNQSAYLIDENFIKEMDVTTKNWDDFSPNASDPACIYYSSGTTGNPKNILISHHNMVANISSVVRGFRFDENDIHLIVLPLGHTAAINYSLLPATLSGGTIILAESFWKVRAKFWSLLKQYNVTYVEVVPSIILALLNTPYSKNDYSNISSLQFIGCGSSMLPLERQNSFIRKYGVKIANLYGLSETGPTHIDYPLDDGWEPGSIGIPLDVNEIKIVNNENIDLKLGEIGEIVIKGANVFIDYYKNTELYNKVVQNGYFHTGDLGYTDKNGKQHFIGRKKELIIKGGINISPDEIDEIVYKIDEVAETLTVGRPDEYLGERIITFIVPKKECNLTKDEVVSHCQNFLSRDKIPDDVRFVEKIPKGHSGKFLRRKVGSE